MKKEARAKYTFLAPLLLFSIVLGCLLFYCQAYANNGNYGLYDYEKYQKGSNREIDGTYYGYAYLIGSDADDLIRVVSLDDECIVYLPKSISEKYNLDVNSKACIDDIKTKLVDLDDRFSETTTKLEGTAEFRITTEKSAELREYKIDFDKNIADNSYIIVNNPSNASDTFANLRFCITCKISTDDAVVNRQDKSPLQEISQFFDTLDWSPLFVSLKSTLLSIVIIFALGLLAAYKALSLNNKARSILDSFFTIPMVLPPTVCGFVLLFLCGRNTGFGRFFIDIGFPLIFSWPATVIACVVVAFPLMYKNALGAFESLDPNLLNAARTLGWSNFKIFMRLMLPLSRSSIAAATVLAYARALGEFGATLFLAGNYVGVTRTIPIAIYFEWMNGNNETAWFWTAIVIVVSFIVILTINIMNYRSTKSLRGER